LSEEFDYGVTLYVSGASDRSAHAIACARRLCDVELGGRCELTIVDVNADRAALDLVGATPTLVRDRRVPILRVVGDLSDLGKTLRALDLPEPSGVGSQGS
jgi:circadian clock protein KaiB